MGRLEFPEAFIDAAPHSPMRTADTVVADLYDVSRDLLPHEQTLLTAYHRITMTAARIKGMACREYGDRSPLHETVIWTANQDCKRHLARALDVYDEAAAAMEEA